MKKDIKVKITLSEGYAERFTAACLKVAEKKAEKEKAIVPQRKAEAG